MAKRIEQIIAEIKEDGKELVQSKIESIQLVAVEKGVPIATKSAYALVLTLLSGIFLITAIITIGFAVALLFTQVGGDAYEMVRATTLGFLVYLGFQVLVIVILLLTRNSIFNKIERLVINKYLDALEQKLKSKETEENTIGVISDITESSVSQSASTIIILDENGNETTVNTSTKE